ncbi:LuxR C-terminal-related transcriptional regulator [Ktedonospora formicarum]|uniref:LuxR family transcriptional regulator n=1 Tax=Ktedonospora formicarum TaxID=2778364 RepID=A0A8J3IBA9_9CHLR|nr:LuxR C-terminal-related transcriptional regulator [Ktedonospora formicarum]GHO50753.1 LuxR family transcriptional regulator [Ktedonospora formicarum]
MTKHQQPQHLPSSPPLGLQKGWGSSRLALLSQTSIITASRGQPSADALLRCCGQTPADTNLLLSSPPIPGAVPIRETLPAAEAASDSSSLSQALLPMLAPKLQVPRLPPSLLPRPRLFKRLESGLSGKLTLISAPAGYGKTTLVSHWIAQRQQLQEPLPFAWLSLDPDDNDPIRFWHYVTIACQPLLAERGHAALTRLCPQASFASSSLELALRTLLNDLATLPHQSTLILNDYQVISHLQIHSTLTFVLDHLPRTIHLILLTHGDPPLPLARWRAHGELSELRADDLRFTAEETTTTLSQALSYEPSPQSISSLDSHLQGWVAGLHFLTLVLQRCRSREQVEYILSTCSGRHRPLLEFFVTEVLCRQPEEVQRFVLQTSILNRFSSSLYNAVTERQDGKYLLTTVEQAGLFLQALDDSQQWYRYHPLFAQAMRTEAHHRFGEAALHAWSARASRWYERQRMLADAVEMALQAQEFERVATLIEQQLTPHYEDQENNESPLLGNLISALPEQVVRQHPRLCVHIAWRLLFSRVEHPASRPTTLDQIERLLTWAQEGWQTLDEPCGRGVILVVRALVAEEQGALESAEQFARAALDCYSELEESWRGLCWLILGRQALLCGRVLVANEHLQQAWTCFQRAEHQQGRHATQLALAEVCLQQGNLRQAAEHYRVVLATAGEEPLTAGKAHLGLARLSYAWNALKQAEQEVEVALAVGLQQADEHLEGQASLLLTQIQQAQGQMAAAQQRLHALIARLPKSGLPARLLHRQMQAQQAQFSLAVGDLLTAERWRLWHSRQQEPLPRLQQEQEELIAAHLLLAQGKPEEALGLLQASQKEAQQMGRTRSHLQILLLQALAYFVLQRRPRAISLLRQALCLAQREGERRLFLDEGEPMQILLRTGLTALDGSLTQPGVYTQPPAEQQAAGTNWWSVATLHSNLLSPQEQRVLALLLTGCSNPEIAQMLVVSINTVKTQVRSIYQKLNVNSRQQVRQLLGRWNLVAREDLWQTSPFIDENNGPFGSQQLFVAEILTNTRASVK